MNREFLITILQGVENAKREHRNNAVLKIIESPNLFPYLIKETFNVDDKLSIRAAWILEWICTHNGLQLLVPHLKEFTENINTVYFDGSVRTCAKICEHISIAYNDKKSHEIQDALTKNQLDKIIEVGFDWLIKPQKIAVKAYTMNTLYLLGFHVEWVHPALADIIRKDIIHKSKGCEARGKKILSLISIKQNRI